MFSLNSRPTNFSNNNVITIHYNENANIENTFLYILNKIPIDESPLTSLPTVVKNSFATAMIVSLLVGTYFKIILYKGIFTTNKQNRGWMHRPINLLIFVSAVIHHITHFIGGIHFILILTIDQPLQHLFGPSYCNLMTIIGIFGIFYLGIGSFGIALYRIMYIKFEQLVKYRIGEKNLLVCIISLSIGICILITYLFLIEPSSRRVAKNMCSGLSPRQDQILIDFQLSTGAIALPTTILQKIALCTTLTFQMCEFAIYVYFLIWRYKHDNGRISQFLDAKDTRKRNNNNIVTFMGQFYGFSIEVTFFLIVTLVTYFEILSPALAHFIKAIAVVIYFLNFGVLSTVEVLTSKSLKAAM